MRWARSAIPPCRSRSTTAASRVTVTGILPGGSAYLWREILGFFGGLDRKFTDEARATEKPEIVRRVARPFAGLSTRPLTPGGS